MCLLASPRHFRSLAIVPLLMAILAFPASAQTTDSNGMGPANARGQSELTSGPTSSNPATQKTDPNSAAPSTQTNSSATKAEPESGGSQSESIPGSKKAGSAILIDINKAKQKMTVFVDGIQKYDWPVSTGRAGYSTPSGTYTATSMNEIWYSKEWDNSPMPHSIFFMKDGHAIHGSYEVKNLGKPVSHGCVRISPENATTLYALVKANGLENTQVILTGMTPGGEFKFARNPAGPGWGFFEPSFGAPYYNGPRGYYRWPSGYSRW
jgi:lipoprotein-anchoring transpeptidase ErfK/SrfK